MFGINECLKTFGSVALVGHNVSGLIDNIGYDGLDVKIFETGTDGNQWIFTLLLFRGKREG